MVFNCLHGQAPPYLVELCQPVAGVASRQHLWSATWQLLVVPRHQLRCYGRQAFCVAGPSVWNSLPDSLRNPIIGRNDFRQSLKTFLFATYWCIQRIRGFTTMRYINCLFTYLLTYLHLSYLLTYFVIVIISSNNWCCMSIYSVMDMLRFHKFTIGHAWMTEFGSPDSKEEFDWLIKSVSLCCIYSLYLCSSLRRP